MTLLVPILKVIQQEGLIAADIARNLGVSKQRMNYYIKRLKEMGFVKAEIRDVHVPLELTQGGKKFLDRYAQNTPSPTPPPYRLENLWFKAAILKMPTILVDWNRIQKNNWVQYTSRINSVFVRLNHGKTPTLEFLPSPLDGDNPNQLFVDLVEACINVKWELYNRCGLEVGSLLVGSRAEFAVYDPVAKSLCRSSGGLGIGQLTVAGIAKVNASAPRNIGEIEFNDLGSVVAYITMPKRLQNMEMEQKILVEKVAAIDKKLDALTEGIKNSMTLPL